QQQFEIISLIDVEDEGQIQAKVKECIEKDPGAFEEEAMVIKIKEEKQIIKKEKKIEAEV
ncbi:MAG: tetrahydromethanopterin S-methyltransferase subunit A, partial [Methanobacterium sp.]